MKVAVFGAKPYDHDALTEANQDFGHRLRFVEARLNRHTARLAHGCEAACIFVNDDAGARSLAALSKVGVRFLALRCAGFDRVHLDAAKELGITVVRVPVYSPHAVAEYTLAMVLTLNRKTHRAYNRVREGNFALNGLLGWDLCGKTVGLIGTGNIGFHTARAFVGLGCKVIAHDLRPNEDVLDLGVLSVSLDELLAVSDLISLHVPLTPDTYHLMDEERIGMMKRGATLVNTSRGGLIDTQAAIDALIDGQLGGLAIDVYEGEGDLFFEDRSLTINPDPKLSMLLSFPNVLVTGHQAFFTREALSKIAEVTLESLATLERGESTPNEVRAPAT